MIRTRLLARLAVLLALYPALTGFVLLSATKATLPVTPASPTAVFFWDGKSPSISEKDKFKGGAYQGYSDTDFMQQLLKDAMDIWNEVPGSFVKLELQPAPDDAVIDDSDQKNSIVIQKSSNLSTAAYAKPVTDPNDAGVIYDCDVNIADTKVTARDLAFTIAHELGHCLGLGHAHTNYHAIMGYSRDNRNLSLGADDEAGVIYLYPDPNYVSAKPREVVCGVAAGEGATAGSLLALLAGLTLPVLGCGLSDWQRRRRGHLAG